MACKTAPSERHGEHHKRRQYHDAEHERHAPCRPTVDYGHGHEHHYAVAKGDARSDGEQRDGFSRAEFTSPSHLHAGAVEREREHEQGQAEVVGHHRGEHDVGERQRERREQPRHEWRGVYDAVYGAVYQHAAEVAAGGEQCRLYVQHAVGAEHVRERGVEPRQRQHHPREQRMPHHIVALVPVEQHVVGDGVEARHVVVAYEPLPCGVRGRAEQHGELACHEPLQPQYHGEEEPVAAHDPAA